MEYTNAHDYLPILITERRGADAQCYRSTIDAFAQDLFVIDLHTGSHGSGHRPVFDPIWDTVWIRSVVPSELVVPFDKCSHGFVASGIGENEISGPDIPDCHTRGYCIKYCSK